MKPVEWNGSLSSCDSSNLCETRRTRACLACLPSSDYLSATVCCDITPFPPHTQALMLGKLLSHLYFERPSWVTIGKGESRSSSTVVVRKSLYLSSRILSHVSH